MTRLSVEQKKERLKRELAKIEAEEKKLKRAKELKDLKIITPILEKIANLVTEFTKNVAKKKKEKQVLKKLINSSNLKDMK